MANIPDCTLTTGCYLLTKYYEHNRSFEETIKSIEPLLSVPCYLVIYCNSPLEESIRNIRNKYNLLSLTKIIVKELEELWAYKFVNKIKENRQTYWPTIDKRISAESTAIVFNKFNFVLNTIQENPFNTSKFGWIDANIQPQGKKICESDFERLLFYTLNNVTEKFHLQVLNVEDKKYKLPENKREYYIQPRWVAVGCFFTTTKDIGIKILSRLQEIITDTINAGYGHHEEYCYLEALDEFYDDIYRGYGDYQQTLHNFLIPIKNHYYIYWNIVINYLYKGYYKECRDVCRKMLKVFDEHLVDMNYDMYIRLLAALLKCSYFIDPDETNYITSKIRKYYNINPLFKLCFDNLKYHIDMADFII